MLELMLVMALLVTVAAVALPAVGLTLDKHQLRGAGELVRTRWAKARIEAMQTGRTYLFRYEPGGRSFLVEPWISPDDYLESTEVGGTGAAMTGGMTNTTASLVDAAVPLQEWLPDSINFVGSAIVDDSRSMLNDQLTGADAQTTLSPPIYFYPDGTSSTARVVLMNQRNRFITVSLRGLTGMVRVSDLQTQSEVQ